MFDIRKSLVIGHHFCVVFNHFPAGLSQTSIPEFSCIRYNIKSSQWIHVSIQKIHTPLESDGTSYFSARYQTLIAEKTSTKFASLAIKKSQKMKEAVWIRISNIYDVSRVSHATVKHSKEHWASNGKNILMCRNDLGSARVTGVRKGKLNVTHKRFVPRVLISFHSSYSFCLPSFFCLWWSHPLIAKRILWVKRAVKQSNDTEVLSAG